MKHTAINYHHFQSFVTNIYVESKHVDTKKKILDIFMIPQDSELFGYLRYEPNGR